MKTEFMLALNFKNNLIDINKYFEQLDCKNQDLILIPSFLQIYQIQQLLPKNVKLGAQNVDQSSRVFTGEISVEMLKQFNISHCLVGHSERRKMANETDKQIVSKLKILLTNNITPILCVGEEKKFSKSKTLKILSSQLKNLVSQQIDLSKIILAYEPVFAIGTNVACDTEHLQFVVDFLTNKYSFSKILYGGSVNENNCENLMHIKNLDGFLIGSASLSYEKINKIAKICSKNE